MLLNMLNIPLNIFIIVTMTVSLLEAAPAHLTEETTDASFTSMTTTDDTLETTINPLSIQSLSEDENHVDPVSLLNSSNAAVTGNKSISELLQELPQEPHFRTDESTTEMATPTTEYSIQTEDNTINNNEITETTNEVVTDSTDPMKNDITSTNPTESPLTLLPLNDEQSKSNEQTNVGTNKFNPLEESKSDVQSNITTENVLERDINRDVGKTIREELESKTNEDGTNPLNVDNGVELIEAPRTIQAGFENTWIPDDNRVNITETAEIKLKEEEEEAKGNIVIQGAQKEAETSFDSQVNKKTENYDEANQNNYFKKQQEESSTNAEYLTTATELNEDVIETTIKDSRDEFYISQVILPPTFTNAVEDLMTSVQATPQHFSTTTEFTTTPFHGETENPAEVTTQLFIENTSSWPANLIETTSTNNSAAARTEESLLQENKVGLYNKPVESIRTEYITTTSIQTTEQTTTPEQTTIPMEISTTEAGIENANAETTQNNFEAKTQISSFTTTTDTLNTTELTRNTKAMSSTLTPEPTTEIAYPQKDTNRSTNEPASELISTTEASVESQEYLNNFKDEVNETEARNINPKLSESFTKSVESQAISQPTTNQPTETKPKSNFAAADPEAHISRTPTPIRIERIFNKDGVEVLYGYSSVVVTN